MCIGNLKHLIKLRIVKTIFFNEMLLCLPLFPNMEGLIMKLEFFLFASLISQRNFLIELQIGFQIKTLTAYYSRSYIFLKQYKRGISWQFFTSVKFQQ